MQGPNRFMFYNS